MYGCIIYSLINKYSRFTSDVDLWHHVWEILISVVHSNSIKCWCWCSYMSKLWKYLHKKMTQSSTAVSQNRQQHIHYNRMVHSVWKTSIIHIKHVISILQNHQKMLINVIVVEAIININCIRQVFYQTSL